MGPFHWEFGLHIVIALALFSGTNLFADSTVTEGFVWASRNGKDLKADLHLPDGPGAFPVVVFLHGDANRTAAAGSSAGGHLACVSGTGAERTKECHKASPLLNVHPQLFAADGEAHTCRSTEKWYAPSEKAIESSLLKHFTNEEPS